MQELVPLCLFITFYIAFWGASSPHHLPKLALPPCPLAQGLPGISGSQNIMLLPVPTKELQLLAVPRRCCPAHPLPNRPADPNKSHQGI